jgi:heme oxygenase
MNSAYIRMQKEHAKRERRSNFIATALGWLFLVGGALVGAAMLYLVTFTFLLLGA